MGLVEPSTVLGGSRPEDGTYNTVVVLYKGCSPYRAYYSVVLPNSARALKGSKHCLGTVRPRRALGPAGPNSPPGRTRPLSSSGLQGVGPCRAQTPCIPGAAAGFPW